VDPGAAALVPVRVTPTDCARPLDPDTARTIVAGLVRADGDEPLPADDSAAATLATVTASLCSDAPRVRVVTDGGPEGAVPDPRTGAVTQRLSVVADPPMDRLVVTPLDGRDRRGLGSAEAGTDGAVNVTWRLGTDPDPARVQVLAVLGRTAFPLLIDVPTP
jgi:hypothetical protein